MNQLKGQQQKRMQMASKRAAKRLMTMKLLIEAAFFNADIPNMTQKLKTGKPKQEKDISFGFAITGLSTAKQGEYVSNMIGKGFDYINSVWGDQKVGFPEQPESKIEFKGQYLIGWYFLKEKGIYFNYVVGLSGKRFDIPNDLTVIIKYF